jgi:hypothetical protein
MEMKRWVIFSHLSAMTEDYHVKFSVGVAGIKVEILHKRLPNTSERLQTEHGTHKIKARFIASGLYFQTSKCLWIKWNLRGSFNTVICLRTRKPEILDSVLRKEKCSSLLHIYQMGFGGHPSSYPMRIIDSSFVDVVAEAWIWQLTSTYCRH